MLLALALVGVAAGVAVRTVEPSGAATPAHRRAPRYVPRWG